MKRIISVLFFLLIGKISFSQTVIFFENFDNYVAGQYVHTQQPLFFPWTGANVEKAYVSNERSHSPNNSMKIVNDNDMVYSFGGKTSGKYQVNFWMFIDTTKGGYFNVEHAFGDSWAFSFYFKPNGMCDIKEGGQTKTFNYNINTWFKISLYFNIDNDSVYAYVDDVLVHKWIFSNEENAPGGSKKLDVINFYGLHNASTGVPASVYYVDDFEFIEIEAGLMPPTININTNPITTNNTSSQTITFSNQGQEVLNFRAYPVFSEPNVTSNLTSGTMRYDNGSFSAIGWQTSFEVYAATRFLPEKTRMHLGQKITSISIFINDPPVGDSIRVYVWKKGGFNLPGTSDVLAEKVHYVFANMDNVITLDAPITITGEELWIGYKFVCPAGQYTIGMDTNTLVPHTSYLKAGPVWSEFTGVQNSMKGNFCIRANVEGPGWPIWLNVSPASGSVSAGASQNLTLSFNTSQLVSGTYEADVVVGCNDPQKEWNQIHVTLTYAAGIDEKNSISVMTYPNPACDILNIISDNMITNISIVSIDGKKVISMQPYSKEFTVNIENLCTGLYFVEISSNNIQIKHKLIKK